MTPPPARTSNALAWTLAMLLLVAARVPAIAQPAGNDQHLYLYTGQRVFEGQVPYVDAWDQKPPGIFFLYGALWQIWPRESVVAIADLGAAAITAWLLVTLGRRTGDVSAGRLAAVVYLAGSHPSLSRLSGVYVRGQSEVFIAMFVTAALVQCAAPLRTRARLIAAGACLGAAFVIKYNAAAYGMATVVALLAWRGRSAGAGGTADGRPPMPMSKQLGWVAAGGAAICLSVLAYFAAHGALEALRLATIDYNVRYSRETYAGGALGAVKYFVTLPIGRMRVDPLWYLGGIGALAMLLCRAPRDRVLVGVAWLASTVASIMINGARDLPQYFVQAGPALAMAAAWGFAALPQSARVRAVVATAVIAVGAWKVGLEAPSFAGVRLFGAPQLAANIRDDVESLSGRIDRHTYLTRFTGGQKYDAAAVDDLARQVRETTRPDDRIFVFGFAPGVYVNGNRRSASRFFWSRPVILEFAADHPGYGTPGLLADLRAATPAIVALQKQDWFPDVANSRDFFLASDPLRSWLDEGYVLDRETPVFLVYRRRS